MLEGLPDKESAQATQDHVRPQELNKRKLQTHLKTQPTVTQAPVPLSTVNA